MRTWLSSFNGTVAGAAADLEHGEEVRQLYHTGDFEKILASRRDRAHQLYGSPQPFPSATVEAEGAAGAATPSVAAIAGVATAEPDSEGSYTSSTGSEEEVDVEAAGKRRARGRWKAAGWIAKMGAASIGSKQAAGKAELAYQAASAAADAAAAAGGDGPTMVTIDPAGVLKLVSFVQYLSGAELLAFANSITRVTVGPGDAFFSEGDEGDDMFIVEKGEVEACIDSIGVVRQYRPGGFFGEKAVFLGDGMGVRSATVRCAPGYAAGASCWKVSKEGISPVLGYVISR